MRKVLLFIASTISWATLFAQHAVVQLDYMNVAYIGLENPISITSDIYNCDQLVVKVNDTVLGGKDC